MATAAHWCVGMAARCTKRIVAHITPPQCGQTFALSGNGSSVNEPSIGSRSGFDLRPFLVGAGGLWRIGESASTPTHRDCHAFSQWSRPSPPHTLRLTSVKLHARKLVYHRMLINLGEHFGPVLRQQGQSKTRDMIIVTA